MHFEVMDDILRLRSKILWLSANKVPETTDEAYVKERDRHISYSAEVLSVVLRALCAYDRSYRIRTLTELRLYPLLVIITSFFCFRISTVFMKYDAVTDEREKRKRGHTVPYILFLYHHFSVTREEGIRRGRRRRCASGHLKRIIWAGKKKTVIGPTETLISLDF